MTEIDERVRHLETEIKKLKAQAKLYRAPSLTPTDKPSDLIVNQISDTDPVTPHAGLVWVKPNA